VNLFVGWTEAELLVAFRAAQDELSAGSQLEAAGSGDVSSTRRVQVGAITRLRMLGSALAKINPVAYPVADYIAPTRTVAVTAETTNASDLSLLSRTNF